MKNEKLISIIVPVYNTKEYLRDCIESVLNQKFDDYELLLIDDGSSDDSYQILSEYKKKDRRIKCFRRKNSGVSATRNFALKQASGKYIMFLDSDDFISDECLVSISNLIYKKNPEIIFFNYYDIKNGNKIKHVISNEFNKERLSSIEGVSNVLSNKGYQGFCWNKVYSKSLIGNIRFDNEIHYMEDVIFNVRILNNTHSIYCIPKPMYYYRWRSNSAVNKFSKKQLTYLNALDILKQIVPNEFKDIVYLKRKLAYLNFSTKVFFIDRKMYRRFKKGYRGISIKKGNYSYLNGYKKYLLIVADRNFFVGMVLYALKNSLVNSKLYTRLKSID